MTERFIIDDCGTLIDIQTRKTYDYVSEVCPILNRYEAICKVKDETIKFHTDGYKNLINTIREAYENEKTAFGKSILKQLYETLPEQKKWK